MVRAEAALVQALAWATFAAVCHVLAASRLLWVVGGEAVGRAGCGCVAFPVALAAAILALGASVKTLEASPVGRQLLGWLLLAAMLAVGALAVWLAWQALKAVGVVVVRGMRGAWGAWGAWGMRPRSAGGVPGGRSPASPFPLGEGDGGRGSPGDGTAQGDAGGPLGAPPQAGAWDAWGPAADDERAHLVQGIVPYGPRRSPKEYVTGIAARRGTLKSFLLADLAVALLSGQPWLGFPLRRCAALLYVDLELDEEEFSRRVRWLARGRGLPGVPAGWHYLDLSGEVLHVPTPEEAARARKRRQEAFGGLGAWLDALAVWGRVLGVENRLTRWGATTQERIVLRARRVGAQAILVDSLSLGGGTAAGDHDGWLRLLNGMQFWGVPVVTLDHTSETGHRGMQGSWVKEGLVRSVLELERDEATGELVVTHSKANFGEQQRRFRVRAAFHRDPRGRVVAVVFARLADGLADAPQVPRPVALPAVAVSPPPAPQAPTERPGPRPLPTPAPPPVSVPTDRPALRVVRGEAGAGGGDPRHDALDAKILAAVATAGADGVDKKALAAATGYAPKTVANSLARLRARGALPRIGDAPVRPPQPATEDAAG